MVKKAVPKYSICMCNYNMAGTLEMALASVLDQLDDRFEVVIVDDGSSDESVPVIRKMQNRHKNLRLVSLQRNPDRHLGFTRNESIKAAEGEYVLLHLDCDDIASPFIKDFVAVFHQIETCLKKDVLLSGRPIQMGKRSFLLENGPYNNIHRGEDRDMWARFAVIDAFVPMDNQNLKTVLPKSFADKMYRAFYYTFDHLRNDFRKDAKLLEFVKFEILHQKNFSWRFRLIRMGLTLPAWLRAMQQGPLPVEKTFDTLKDFSDYQKKFGGTFTEIMHKNNCEPDWSQLSAAARSVF